MADPQTPSAGCWPLLNAKSGLGEQDAVAADLYLSDLTSGLNDLPGLPARTRSCGCDPLQVHPREALVSNGKQLQPAYLLAGCTPGL